MVDKNIYIEETLIIIGKKNLNHHTYTLKTAERIIVDFYANRRIVFGQMGKIESTLETKMNLVCCQLIGLKIIGYELIGTFSILDNHNGDKLRDILEHVVFRPNSIGYVETDGAIAFDKLINISIIPKDEDAFKEIVQRNDVFIANEQQKKIMTNMRIKVVNKSPWELPKYETKGSAGMDIKANIDNPLVIHPNEIVIVPTGIFIQLPPNVIEVHSGEGTGIEAQIRPRSGMAAKYGITVLNTPGTIDSDYRGEIKVILINHSEIAYRITSGDNIAQMVFNKVIIAALDEVDVLDVTDRGEGGFGHTGK